MNTKKTPSPPRIIQAVSTIFMLVAGVTLIFCAIYTEPKGEIHTSVLFAFGMILTWAGTMTGIDYKIRDFRFDAYNILSELKSGTVSIPKPPRKTSKQKVPVISVPNLEKS